MAQVNGLLQLLWINRPPLGAAPAASIHQGSAAARAVASKPVVGRAEAEPSLSRQISQGLSVLNLSTHKQFLSDRCQSGIGVDMHAL